jgi:signal transduction histidine kinase
MRPTTGGPADRLRLQALTLLAILAALLVLTAVLVLAAAFAVGGSIGLGLGTLALAPVLGAVLCWHIRDRMLTHFQESRVWTEVGLLKSTLAEREMTWAALPAPGAAWDAEGRLLFATASWHSLGLSTRAPPSERELAIGEPARVFVVESCRRSSGARLTVLREVTREREALQAKDELLAIVGHEMRTPLSSIKGYGQMMSRQLGTLQEQVQRMDQLIGDILDTAGADTGRLSLRREPLSVRDIVTSACERFELAHPSRRVERRLEAEALIEGDSVRLSQVMDNLLSNAAKYSPPDAPVAVHTSMDGEWVRIAVRDRGVGVSAEHLPRLFDRFYRVPAGDVAAPKGFGLGLSIVRDLVEAHGGRVEALSDGPGTGSTFIVTLPAALALQPESSEAARAIS